MSQLRQIVILILVAAVPAAIAAFLHPRRPPLNRDELQTPTVDARKAQDWGDRVLWVDARSPRRFEEGHIPGAVLLNEGLWQAHLDGFLEAWEPEKIVVVYCDDRECESSQAVATRLSREAEITPIFVLEGGWQAWKARQKSP